MRARSLAPLLLLPLLFGGASQGTKAPKSSPKVTAYVFLATDCPIAGRYGPRLARLLNAYEKRGVRFIAVFPNDRESKESITGWLKDRKLAKLTPSRNVELVKKLGASYTPQAVVTDGTGKVRYSGRLDDADDPARVKDKSLSLALDAVLAGKKVARATTKPFGCPLTVAMKATAAEPAKGVAFATVQPIFEKHCVPCHKRGEVGPMPLDDFKTAVGFAQKIKEQTQTKRMPPWKADSNGEFHDEHKLTESEITTVVKWAANPASESGSPAPPQPELSTPKAQAWHLGKPDAVYTMPAYTAPAEGKDIYRCFVIPSGNKDEDRWVKGIEIQPGNRSVVHHSSVFIDLSGVGRKMDEAAPGPGYTNPTPGNGPGFNEVFSVLGGWTPGHQPRKLPIGTAIYLPKGADLVLEVHYHLTGKPEPDQTKFGVYYASEPIDKRMYLGGTGSQSFTIPPGAKNYKIEASQHITGNVTLLSITPHMHERGIRMVAWAELPSGERRNLIDVPRWDFQWQPSYRFKEPMRLPKHTKIMVEGYFDNPTSKPITWGESTTDEMCVLFSAYTNDDEHLLDDPVIIR